MPNDELTDRVDRLEKLIEVLVFTRGLRAEFAQILRVLAEEDPRDGDLDAALRAFDD